MKILFGLMLYLMIEYILKFRKKSDDNDKLEKKDEFLDDYFKKISNSVKQKNSISETQKDYYFGRTSVDLSKLIACAKKLGFEFEELSSEEIIYLVKRLDITGDIPAFFRLKSNGTNVIISLREGCFALLGNFVIPERYTSQEIAALILMLNNNQIDSFPIQCLCNDIKGNLEVIFFTLHKYQYEDGAFEQIFKMFMAVIAVKMKHILGVEPKLPECISSFVKEDS